MLACLVELPDTASGSEIPHGHNSTRIVSCFDFAYIAGCKKQKLINAVAKFSNRLLPRERPYFRCMIILALRNLRQEPAYK